MQESVALGQVSSVGPAVGLSEEQIDRQTAEFLSLWCHQVLNLLNACFAIGCSVLCPTQLGMERQSWKLRGDG